ncbi:cysteine hydrolase [Allokutzneria sp. A3M-2-11 16]|uniref:cysteine hydrolase family protein n=1 Tax=Allokutzneria sp. A3M-2-11 16 TaxID=2962043 RepID=UPI0020B7067F|nr:cysteine hydrolase [Allokutzneria sp. A3M-2-11 16]MCP3803750.1 cysteine hydrolase [Allokutzneria sp. A3M-2-11 16]
MSTALIIGDLQRGITGNYPFTRQVLPPDSELLRSFYEAGDAFHEGSGGTELDLPVADEDVVVLKRRASAFAGTDLDLVLRARGVDTLAIAGVATSAMVAATAYDAADRGYRVTVLRDGCADGDQAMHDFFVDAVFPSRGFEVVSCADWALYSA